MRKLCYDDIHDLIVQPQQFYFGIKILDHFFIRLMEHRCPTINFGPKRIKEKKIYILMVTDIYYFIRDIIMTKIIKSVYELIINWISSLSSRHFNNSYL